jgi:Family of unknown function (DUF6152)
MRNWLFASVLAVCSLTLLSGSLFAHHSSSWADTAHPRTLTGKVVEWNFINPHITMILAVKDEAGNIDNWTIEFNSPQSLGRSGWTIKTVKPGDEVTLTGSPSKDGRKLMAHQGEHKVIINGKELALTRTPQY